MKNIKKKRPEAPGGSTCAASRALTKTGGCRPTAALRGPDRKLEEPGRSWLYITGRCALRHGPPKWGAIRAEAMPNFFFFFFETERPFQGEVRMALLWRSNDHRRSNQCLASKTDEANNNRSRLVGWAHSNNPPKQKQTGTKLLRVTKPLCRFLYAEAHFLFFILDAEAHEHIYQN